MQWIQVCARSSLLFQEVRAADGEESDEDADEESEEDGEEEEEEEEEDDVAGEGDEICPPSPTHSSPRT